MLSFYPERTVRCYHCQRDMQVAMKAITLSCPHCYKLVHVGDVVVEKDHQAASVRTCGVVVVGKKGRLHASQIEASQGIQVLGELAGDVVCHGPVVIGARAIWRGDCSAAKIVIEPGATILDGRFTIRGAAPSHA
jgi:hypothetical protein